jgi:UDP-N-acetylmuramate dehydrogenase
VTAAAADLQLAGRILRERCGSRCKTMFELAPLTTFRVGGPAALFLEPQDDADLAAASEAIRDGGVPFIVLGRGSNVLVSDAGFAGLVLRLGRGYRWAARDGERLVGGGAMPLPALAGVALRHSLSGMEFGVAIPATLGGAVRMNAGAHGAEMSDVVEGIEVFRLLDGRRDSIPAVDVRFGYRRSSLREDAVVVAATTALASGEPGKIRARMEDARAWRRQTQPLAEPNCGSVFTNPTGDHAARVIEAAGLKGTRVGGAQVSKKHANFIVADVGTRAVDVLGLIRLVRARVLDSAGVDLEPEVRLVGEFPDG